MIGDVKTWLIIFIILFSLKPALKILRLIYNMGIIILNPRPLDFKEKYGEWAVITGATHGIGKEFAKQFATRDLNLVLISRSIEKLNKTKDELQLLNLNIHIKVIAVDFSQNRPDFDKIRKELKDITVSILVNNVGVGFPPIKFHELSENELWDMINLHVTATVFMTHLVIEDMKTRKNGAIINLSSGADMFPFPTFAVYGATKAFVTFFTDALRQEYSTYGITVQGLSPFYLNTRMFSFSFCTQHIPIICPDAKKFVRSALKTFGKLDSTPGTWIHEIIKTCLLLFPMYLRQRILWLYVYVDSYPYRKSLKKLATETKETLEKSNM